MHKNLQVEDKGVYSTILQMLEETMKKYPNKVAFEDMKDKITFSNLVEQAIKIGSFIGDKIAPQNPIVVYMDKRANNVIAFMGVVYAGCFYVPIDSQMPLERIKIILETLKPSMILYDDVTKDRVKEFGSCYSLIHYKKALETDVNKTSLLNIRSQCKNTDILYVLFTSGSTGVPKGVTISHAAVIDFVDWICENYHMSKDTSLCNQAPFYFDASVPDLYIPLKVGATTYVPPKSYYTFPKKILEYLDERKINTLIWVPSALCNVVNCRAFEVCIPSNIKLVIFCGEVMPCKHLNVWKNYIPDALYVNMYGPTEATYACMYYNIERIFKDDEVLPLGRACENSQILLLDENNKIAERGQVGEICILGQCLSQGYYNAQDKTNQVFVQNPTNSKWNEIIYKTGDLAYENADGDIIFAGRKDFQIKKLGHRIELGEIESVMLSIKGVESVCCIYNELEEHIIAVYKGIIQIEELRNQLNVRLSQYMRPDRYQKVDQMPLNMNGKIDRLKIKNIFMEEK